ncbi:MAG: carbohydrate binding family 9 domain-containing protein, partial [Acidobacteria bacterium]|nr:carbohydrate binding family 9 domain-containing protein [Acidobacteriota bacterium]
MGRRASCLLVLALTLSAGAGALPAQETTVKRPVLVVPRVERPPELEDFLEMRPADGVATRLAKVEGFLQRAPSDGASASQRTEAYLGYDDRNLYVIFVCFDSEPEKIRARMVPREQLFSDQGALDDIVSVDLDTFLDQRRAYVFTANPLGIQADTIWTEGQGHDSSFDTVWQSRGRLTPQGYVVWMAIPFKSLRFPATADQSWGILLNRDIPRNNEETYWPHYSSRIEGRLNQTAYLQGLAAISPGRNLQFIPYGAFRSFRALDTRDPAQPRFVRDRDDPDVGLDAKLVFQDSLVLDLALNPDFSQVESDEPQ